MGLYVAISRVTLLITLVTKSHDPLSRGTLIEYPALIIRMGSGVYYTIVVVRNPKNSTGNYVGVSEIRGTLFWGPYNKDPTI